jgi:N-carbamoylputrescine amidase
MGIALFVMQQELGLAHEGIICHQLDFAQEARDRAAWGFFRDRRPELYSLLTQP